jgi:hypothetical protein
MVYFPNMKANPHKITSMTAGSIHNVAQGRCSSIEPAMLVSA